MEEDLKINRENNGIVDLRSDKAIWEHVQKICEERLKVGEEDHPADSERYLTMNKPFTKVGEPKE